VLKTLPDSGKILSAARFLTTFAINNSIPIIASLANSSYFGGIAGEIMSDFSTS